MRKKIIQICFSLKTGLTIEKIKTKLLNVKDTFNTMYGENNFEVHSCHLSKKLCEEKGFSTEVPDLFNEIFGTNYVCELTEETFDEAMANINDHRKELSRKADNLVMITNDDSNVSLELQLFTQGKVFML